MIKEEIITIKDKFCMKIHNKHLLAGFLGLLKKYDFDSSFYTEQPITEDTIIFGDFISKKLSFKEEINLQEEDLFDAYVDWEEFEENLYTRFGKPAKIKSIDMVAEAMAALLRTQQLPRIEFEMPLPPVRADANNDRWYA